MALLSRFVSVLSLMCLLNPRNLRLLLLLGRGGGHKNRRKAQPPPQFHSDEGLSSPDESSTLLSPADDQPDQEVIQKSKALNTALAAT